MAMLGARNRVGTPAAATGHYPPGLFSFYQPGMSFEAFVSHFAEWFSQRRPAAVLVGIRADESLNRFMTISSQRKQRFADDKPWTTSAPGGHARTSTRSMTGKPPISGHGLPKRRAL